jgi:polysaccharide biosynthesis protein PslE
MAADFFRLAATAADRDEPGFRVTLAQVRTFLPRYKWVIAGTFVMTVLSAYSALNLMTDQYEARAALLVKLGRENLDPPATARNAVLSTGVRREELGSEAQILRSTDLLGEVVDELGVEAFRVTRVPPPTLFAKIRFYAKKGLRWTKRQYQEALYALNLKRRLSEREAAIALLLDELHAEPQKDSDVVALSLRLADPALAVRVEEALIHKYLTRRVEVRQNPGVKEFFDRETRELAGELTRAEEDVQAWKRQRGLTVPAEQKALLLRQIRELLRERDHARSESSALSSQKDAAASIIAGAAERVSATEVQTPNPALQQVRERLTKLEAERTRLLTTYKPGTSPVRVVEDEIAGLRALAAGQEATQLGSVTTEINPVRRQMQQTVNQNAVQIEGLSAAQNEQERQLARLQAELRSLEDADARLATLERERAVAEQQYLAAVKRLQDADIERELDRSRISNVSVAMPPAATLEPVYPRKLLIMALSLAVGLVLGLACAIVLEWTSDAVHDAEDLEATTDLVCLAAFGPKRGKRRFPGAA